MTIFMSYARQDATVTESIREAFERIGRQVWIDRKLTGGQDWWDVILQAIRECEAFVICMSTESARSEACGSELRYAIETARPLMPIMIGDVDTRLFGKAVADIQYVDYRVPGVSNTIDLVNAINGLAQPAPLPEPLPTPPPVPVTYLDEYRVAIGAETLNYKEQEGLLAALRARLDDEEDHDVMVELLTRFRRRPDVTKVVADEIDRILVAPAAQLPTPQAGPRKSPPNGPVVAITSPSTAAGTPQPAPTSGAQHRFVAPNCDPRQIADRLKNWMVSEKLEAQIVEDDQAIVIQCRSAQKWKMAIGAGVAFTVRLTTDGPDLLVEMGHAQWADKAAAGAVALFIAWPAIIPAVWGAAQQKTLPEKALRLIEQSIPECSRV